MRVLTEQGGSLVITAREDGEGFVAGFEFGHEAPDSPMVGGAAYGIGDSISQALEQVANDLR